MIHNFKFKDTHLFRAEALYFMKHNCYNDGGVKGTPLYKKYWKEQERRCLEGYEVNGVRITGYHYFYLNFCPIIKTVATGNSKINQRQAAERVEGFPDFWDLDWMYYTALEIAEQGVYGDTLEEKIENYNKLPIELNIVLDLPNLSGGQHMLWLKPRGVGASWKGASMPARNFFFIRQSKSYMYAESKEFLNKDGIFTKFLLYKNFINTHTPFRKYTDVKNDLNQMHIRASHKDSMGNEKGYLSEIMGVPVGGDTDKIRGKRGKICLFEEFGAFTNGSHCWEVQRSSVEEGKNVFGTMVGFGCVCAGTKVWTADGSLINIEDLKQEYGLLGFDIKNGVYSVEPITYMQPPAEKECVRITTNTGRVLECSDDHPILYSTMTMGSNPRRKDNPKLRTFFKKTQFIEAGRLKVGDQVAIAEEISLFGTKTMSDPRLIGWLIGDGSYSFDKTPRLSNCEPEIIDYLESNYDCVTEREYLTKTDKVYKEIRIKNMCPTLRELGIYGQTKNRKTLPVDIHSYTKHDICELLGGLFDTDGYVSKDYRVSLTSMSKDLLLEVSLLLQKIGVHGTIQRVKAQIAENRKDINDHYRLEVSDKKSVLTFIENVTLYPEVKRQRLVEAVSHYAKKESRLSKTVKGLRFERVVSVEEIGMKPIYNLTAGNTHTYIANGIVTHNTGGTEGKAFEAMEKMMFSPSSHNILRFNNIYDEDLIGTECAFFTPAYMNVAFKDADGNTDLVAAREYLDGERAKKLKSPDPNDVARAKAEHPYKPTEALLRTTSSILPKAELLNWKTELVAERTRLNTIVYGDLHDTKGVEFKPDFDARPVLKFPHDNKEDNQGCVTIFQTPYREDGKVPPNLYVVCVDPYMHDSTQGDSLGAAYVLKNINNFSKPDDYIVASFVGRPASMDLFHKKVRQLAQYYNAKIGYENNAGQGLLSYFKNNKYLDLLAPEFELGYNENLPKSTVRRGYGMHIDQARKKLGLSYLADWLLKPWMCTEDGLQMYNYHKIIDLGLLEELIKYDDNRNVDRVSALIIAMFHMKEIEWKHGEIKKESSSSERLKQFFSGVMFQ